MASPPSRTCAGEFRVHVLGTAEAVRAVAERVIEAVLAARGAGRGVVLGLPTGRTQIPVYAELSRRVAKGDLSLRGVTTFNLDEYVGLGPDHPASFAAYMRRHLVERTDIDPARVFLPRGDGGDPQAEAERYEQALSAAGGIDLMLLGVGANGHIAFNEPGATETTRTRVVRLSPQTRAANAADFPPAEQVPERAITVGVGTILEARRIVVLVTGAAKREAVRRMLTGPIGPEVPASFLRRRRACEVWLDEEAAGGLGR